MMNQTIDRISAQREMRLLTAINAAQSVDGTKEYRETLNGEIGAVVVSAERDANATNTLKSLM